jgi:hypothetical protein
MSTTDNPLSSTLAELQDLLTWPDDWNTYGAQAPKPASVSRATAWITETHQHLQQSWIKPHVGVNGDGEVEFDWRNEQRKLSIYFDEQEIDYLQVDGKGINAPMYDGTITSIEDMQHLWQWLLDAEQEQEA